MTISIADATVYADDANKPTDGQKVLTDLTTLYNEINNADYGVSGSYTFAGPKTFSGVVTISQPPTNPTDAVNKSYVDSFFTGFIYMFGGASAPSGGFLACNGQAVSRTTYAALFAAIGTTWGSGDGSTTFNVPDFTTGFPVGSSNLGGTNRMPNHTVTTATLGGEERHTMTLNELVGHTHTEKYTTVAAMASGATTVVAMTGSDQSGPQTGSTGGSTPFNVIPPYVPVLFYIKT